MNVALKPISADAFMAWLEQQPSWRYELVHGQIVAMNPQRLEHIEVKVAVVGALKDALRGAGFHAIGDGMCVRIDEATVYEPDALVYGGKKRKGSTTLITDPIAAVEILSPGTKTVDTTKKLEGYFKLPSVRHYLIVDPAERAIVHHARDGEGAIATSVLTGGMVPLTAISAGLPVAACFADDARA